MHNKLQAFLKPLELRIIGSAAAVLAVNTAATHATGLHCLEFRLARARHNACRSTIQSAHSYVLIGCHGGL
jgi:hypothetical protein